jgi:hypothetical protein
MLFVQPHTRQVHELDCYVTMDAQGGMRPHDSAFRTAGIAMPRGIKARIQETNSKWKVLVIYFDEHQGDQACFQVLRPPSLSGPTIHGCALVVLYTANNRDLTDNRRIQNISVQALGDLNRLFKFVQ